jgi:hypothetical protein
VALATPAWMTVQVLPPFRLTSTLNVAEAPRSCVHVIVRSVPIRHGSEVFGEVTVTNGDVIVKLPSFVSTKAELVVDRTRTRAVVVVAPDTVQLNHPAVADAVPRTFQVEPPFRLSSTTTLPPMLLVQVTLCVEPSPHSPRRSVP